MREETLAEISQKINNLIRLTHLSLDLTLPVEVNPKAIRAFQAMRKRTAFSCSKIYRYLITTIVFGLVECSIGTLNKIARIVICIL